MTTSHETAGVPSVQNRTPQPYAAIATRASMDTLAEHVPALMPAVFAGVARAGRTPSGPPFWRYRFIDMPDRLDLEVGVPVDAGTAGDAIEGSGDLEVGELPGGRYATVVHVGHPDGLLDATRDLLGWAEAQGLRLDRASADGGERWGCRLEEYLTDPAEQPDMTQWQTRLAFRLAD